MRGDRLARSAYFGGATSGRDLPVFTIVAVTDCPAMMVPMFAVHGIPPAGQRWRSQRPPTAR